MKPKQLVLLASGSGSNVENIAKYFETASNITIATVLTNKRDAKVIDRCNRLKINCLYFNKQAFSESDCILNVLESINPDLIVLAGFLWKIPEKLILAFPNRIINIHPALLPKYGGKGMYGNHVHEAVKKSKDAQTGITIHYVTANYDEGAIIHQATTKILPEDKVEQIAGKVHQLEYEHFPKVIEELLSKGNL